ncbi:hypothetical protein BC826DRAFT_1075939 [Russula brevipes]|nr:hypothetical protein BC826DRAFT_1075939 [Russula brevipes]
MPHSSLFTKGRPRGPSSVDDKAPEDMNPAKVSPPLPLASHCECNTSAPCGQPPESTWVSPRSPSHLPTFVVELRGMLEHITDFMARPDLIFGWVSHPGGHSTTPFSAPHMLMLFFVPIPALTGVVLHCRARCVYISVATVRFGPVLSEIFRTPNRTFGPVPQIW